MSLAPAPTGRRPDVAAGGPGPARAARGPWAAVGAALTLGAVGSLFVGVSDLSPLGLVRADPQQVWLLLVSRLPRLLAVLLSGAAMSVAGLIMQHLARNRFVAPSTAGTIESASLGILVATIALPSAPLPAKMLVAIGFALAGTAAFLALLRCITFRDVILVPLVGLMLGAVIRAVTTLVAYRMDLLQTLGTWTTGDFSGVLRGRYELLAVAGLVAAAAYLIADRLTVAGMGRDLSVSLGVSYERTLALGLAAVATITGITVVVVGAVPFIGLVVPNIVSMAAGDRLRRSLPLTALAGAALVLVCDLVGRLVRYPYEIPVGTVAGMLGSVVFVVLITRSRRGR